jgi:uncharacterized phage protein (TIGR01671 family)
MNRVIKFRVWDKQTRQMSPSFVLFGEFTLLGAVHSWQHDCGNKAESSLEALNDLIEMQFTGLHDKSGKEIYESDIVEVANTPDDQPPGIYDVTTVCEFENGMFQLTDLAGGHWNRQLYNQPERLTVIGNKFERPELLQEIKKENL